MPSWTNLNPFSPGQVLTADNVNDLRENAEIGHTICTSSTRPASPANGQMIYETDTGKLLVYAGSAWQDVFPAQPVGSLTAYAGAAAPTGWLLCDGSAVSRTSYSGLFSVLSTTYGAGDGSTTFNLPDLRGRVPVGAGTDGAAENAYNPARGAKFGDYRTQSHVHTGTTGFMNQNWSHGHIVVGPAGHSHGVWGGGPLGTFRHSVEAINTDVYGLMEAQATDTNHTHNFTTGSAGSGGSQNQPPSLGVNYIIKF